MVGNEESLFLALLGDSKWRFQEMVPAAEYRLPTTLYAAEGVINTPVEFTVDAEYIDGFELYEKIRTIDNKVKVWFITAYETYHKVLKEVLSTSQGEMGPGPVIEKPIEIDELVKQIRTELD